MRNTSTHTRICAASGFEKNTVRHAILRSALLCVLLLAIQWTAAAQTTKRLYLVGNSVTDAINYGGLKAMAESRGNTHIWARHMIPGAPLSWLWEHPNDGFQEAPFGYPNNAFPNYTWDAILLQPFDRSIDGSDGDLEMVKNYVNLAKGKSPSAQFYIYMRWPRTPNDKSPADASLTADTWTNIWNKPYTGGWGNEESKGYFESLLLATRTGVTINKPLLIIPVGEVFNRLNAKMKNGQVTGYNRIWQVYSDGIHMNSVGSFIAATTFYATIYKDDPRGIAVPSQYSGISGGLASIIQETVWEVVSAYQYSGVSGIGAVAVTGVSVAPSTLSLNAGQTGTLTATVIPAGATNKNVAWSSSNTAVATVNASGLVTAVSAGTAVITATTTDGAKTASSTLTVTQASAAAGLNYQFYTGTWSALPNFAALSPVKTGTAANFDLSPRTQNDNFAFRFTGTLTISAAGSYTFFTTSDDGSKLHINGAQVVNNDGLHGAAEKSGTVTLAAGTHSIEVTMFEAGGGEVLEVRWQGPGIAKQLIPNSVLSNSTGTPVASVAVSPATASVMVGKTRQLTATVTPVGATNKNVAWSSANTAVATVNASGLVTAISAGSAVITATTADGAKTASSTLTVFANSKPVARITATPVTGTAPLAVSFNANTSTDPDAGDFILGYEWDFGDGSAKSNANAPSHTYAAAGSYTVTLRVMDNNNLYGDPVTALIAVSAAGGGGATPTSTLAQWIFAAKGGQSTVPATDKSADVATAATAFGSGLTAINYLGNGFTASDQTATTQAAALTGNDYIALTLKPVAGKSLTITRIDFRPVSQNVSRTFALFSSVGGFAAGKQLGTFTANANNGAALTSLAISGHASLTAETEFRLYVYGGGNRYEAVGLGNRSGASGYDLVVSGSSASTPVPVADTQAPTVPSGLAASGTTQTGFTLNWAASTDNVGVTGYEVYRNGTLAASPTTNTTTLTGLSAGTTYAMTVKARDAAGNLSAASATLSVSTLPTPAIQYTLAVTGGTGGGSYAAGTAVSISANAAPTGQVFDAWTGDTGLLASAAAASTTLTMPARNAAVTATYRTVPPTGGGTAIAINKNTTYQTMDGFGFFGARDVWWGSSDPAHFHSDAWVDKVINDLGVSIWRNEIYPHIPANSNNTPNQDANWDKQRPTVLALKAKAQQSGVDLKFVLTVWSPPGVYKWSSNSTWAGDANATRGPGPQGDYWNERNGGTLNPNKYNDFAAWLGQAVQMYKDAGVNVYALSPQNEPMFAQTFNSCTYTTQWYNQMVKAVLPKVRTLHPGLRFFGSENMLDMEGADNNYPYFYHNALKNDAAALGQLDILAVHGYLDGVSASSGTNLAKYWANHKQQFSAPGGKKAWMTETSGYLDSWEGDGTKPGAFSLALDIHSALAFGDVSGWVHWQGSGLGGINEYNLMSDLEVGKKYYASKQYYRFVRPGAVRLAATSPDADVALTAFHNPALGTHTVILLNTATTAKNVVVNMSGSGLPAQYEMFVTSASNNCVSQGLKAATATITLPPRSIVTMQAGGTALGSGTTPPPVADTQAPSVPAGLAASNATQTGFTLNWTASTDNVGVTGYEVYRNGTLVASPTGTSASLTGLPAGTAHAMTVRAKDAAGNLSAVSATLNVSTLPAPVSPPPVAGGSKLPIGMNLSSLSYYDASLVFTNAMTTASDLMTFVNGGSAWNTEKTGGIPIDTAGYPTMIPYAVDGMPQLVRFMINNFYSGRYVVLHDGVGTLRVNAAPSTVIGGKLYIDFNGQGGHVWIDILTSQAGNHVRNIRILPEQYANGGTYPTFLPKYLEGLRPFHAMRLMDWTSTNNSTQKNWSDRITKTHYSQGTARGMALEYAIELCNELKSDAWFCVPHAASDDYMRRMARLIRDRLNANLKVYVEYSNEVWNWQFQQAGWVLNNAPGSVDSYVSADLRAINPASADHPEKNAYMMARTFRIFKSEFTGTNASRLVRVAAVQHGWYDNTRRVLEYLKNANQQCDVVSPAGYFSYEEADHNAFMQRCASVTPAEVIQAVETGYDQTSGLWTQKNAEYAKQYNVGYVVYEGGQHMQPWMQGDWCYNNAVWDAQIHPKMYDLYMRNFRKHTEPEVNCSLFMAFSYMGGRQSKYGSWGHLESLNQVGGNYMSIAPKYQALLDANAPKGSVPVARVNQAATADSFTPYPNPAQTEFSVGGLTGAATVELVGPQGKVVYRRTQVDSRTMLSLAGLPSGLYMVRIQVPGQATVTRKLVKN